MRGIDRRCLLVARGAGWQEINVFPLRIGNSTAVDEPGKCANSYREVLRPEESNLPGDVSALNVIEFNTRRSYQWPCL
jgi:hypothetical protein